MREKERMYRIYILLYKNDKSTEKYCSKKIKLWDWRDDSTVKRILAESNHRSQHSYASCNPSFKRFHTLFLSLCVQHIPAHIHMHTLMHRHIKKNDFKNLHIFQCKLAIHLNCSILENLQKMKYFHQQKAKKAGASSWKEAHKF